MQVSFINQRADAAALAAFVRNPWLQYWAWLDYLAALIFVPEVIAFIVGMNSTADTGVIAFIVSAMIGIALRLWHRGYTKARSSRRTANDANSEVIVTISPEWFQWKTPHMQLRFGWDAFTKLQLVPGYVLIKMTPQGAYYVPRRAFASDAEMRDFFVRADAYWEASRFGREQSPSVWPPRPEVG